MLAKPRKRVVIIENEVVTLRSIELELKKWTEDFQLIGSFTDPQRGVQEVRRSGPDIVFLNINLPFFNGLELLGNQPANQSKIIFLATAKNYVHQAIKSGRIDCLMKPLVLPEFRRLLRRLSEGSRMTQMTNNFNNSVQKKEDFKFDKMSLPTGKGFIFVDPKDIIYCEAQQEYTIVRFLEEEVLVSKNLKHFENILDKRRFFRIHKSYLLNLEHIKSYSKSDGGTIETTNDQIIYVGRSKKKEFSQLMGV